MQKQITITAIASGWLVVIPMEENTVGGLKVSELFEQVSSALNTEGTDELLNSLKKKGEEILNEIPVYNANALKDKQNHFFKSFPEVLEFLGETVIDHPQK